MKKLIGLSIPVALTYLGPVLMNLVDIIAVCRLGAAAIGAVALGGAYFYTTLFVGRGLLAGLDYFISRACGARDLPDLHGYFRQGFYLAVLYSVLLGIVHWILSWHLVDMGVNPEVAELAGPYIRILSGTVLPAMLFTTCRQFLQAVGIAHVGMFVMLAANVVNALGNYALVYGHFGLPALGVEGSGWATFGARFMMMSSVFVYVLRWGRWHHIPFALWAVRLDWRRMSGMLGLGVFGAMQFFLEYGVYSTMTFVSAGLETAPLAAHQVVLSIISFTSIVPQGIAAATAVLTGQALGRLDVSETRKMGWRGLQIVGLVALFTSLLLYFQARPILRLYTDDPKVIAFGSSLMVLAALLQLFDGTLVVAAGALRGLGNTKDAAYATLIGQWLCGMPTGLYLCRFTDLGVEGLWVGLFVGLAVSATLLCYSWIVKSTHLVIAEQP
jgi:MATE family multidrug resistance protein